jgi:hypothetical protein
MVFLDYENGKPLVYGNPLSEVRSKIGNILLTVYFIAARMV